MAVNNMIPSVTATAMTVVGDEVEATQEAAAEPEGCTDDDDVGNLQDGEVGESVMFPVMFACMMKPSLWLNTAVALPHWSTLQTQVVSAYEGQLVMKWVSSCWPGILSSVPTSNHSPESNVPANLPFPASLQKAGQAGSLKDLSVHPPRYISPELA